MKYAIIIIIFLAGLIAILLIFWGLIFAKLDKKYQQKLDFCQSQVDFCSHAIWELSH